jgi:hypothetical protein
MKPNLFDANAEHQIDVFVHSWYDADTPGTLYYAANDNPTFQKATDPIPSNVIQQLYDNYNPVRLELERPRTFDVKRYYERRMVDAIPENGMSRLYSINRVLHNCRSYAYDAGFTYDVIVNTRYDFILNSPVKFDSVVESGVYHPGFSPHGFNVCFAMGKSNDMGWYGKLYGMVDAIFNTGVTWCDELLTVQHLKLLDIPTHNLHIPNGINRGTV